MFEQNKGQGTTCQAWDIEHDDKRRNSKGVQGSLQGDGVADESFIGVVHVTVR